MATEWKEKRKFGGRNYTLRRVGKKDDILAAQKRWKQRNARTRVIYSNFVKKRPDVQFESGRYALYVRSVNI